ncbi:GntR family transcriptional regulator [Halodurantibacterium flavum]|uniref:GntR family transcriptional regulator n=1 Tax=Halodurantibacterium flavum TaxID=1382802 RepID=A0ABW4S0T2_9RHOB
MTSRDRPRGLAQAAHARIITMILDGDLQPGDALQEARLGAVLGMSRTPVREAIKRIESEGLARQQGRFLRVRLPDPAEIDEIFWLRRLIEPPAAAAAVALPRDRIDAMEVRVRALIDGAGAEDLWRVDDDFHAMIAGAGGNRAAVQLLADLRKRTCMFDTSQVPERYQAGCREHLDILSALRAHDGAAARDAMARHLDHACDAILRRLAGGRGPAPQAPQARPQDTPNDAPEDKPKDTQP